MPSRTYITDRLDLIGLWASDSNEKLGLDPHSLSTGSHVRAYWLCTEGHEWSAEVCAVARGGRCSVCRGLQVIPGVNDFASAYPNHADMWDYTSNDKKPQEYSAGSGARVWFVCENGHRFDTVLRRIKEGNWCRYCAKKDIWVGENDLSFTHPLLAKEWDEEKNGAITPSNVSRGSNKDIWWRCSINSDHSWQAKPNDRTRPGAPTGCPYCANIGSKGQDQLIEYIKEELKYDHGVLTNYRGLLPGKQEVDVYIPEMSVAFEFHGLYFHSDGPRGSSISTASKVESAKHAGVDLYIVWEDDWRDRQSIVKKWISGLLGTRSVPSVGARSCVVERLNNRESSRFLEENHIQGSATGKYYVGLKESGSIVAVAVLSSWNSGNTLRLERYATSKNVQGGFTKIVSWVDRNIKYKTMETFADHSYSKGSMYESTGWAKSSTLRPDYSYLVNKTRVHKFNFRKKAFRTRDDLVYEEGKTEHELALMNKIYRVYDAGKTKYVRDNLHAV